MPSPASNEEKPKKRVTRKRASVGTKTVRKTAARRAVRKRTTRPTAKTTVPASKNSDERQTVRTNRKAPTAIADRKATNHTKRKQQIIFFSALVVSIGLSAVVGLSDDGQIDVNQTIEERNERIKSGQLGENETQRILVPVQNTEANRLPDGGLVGLGVGAGPPVAPPAPETASTTASTTDATASSTDEVTSSIDEPTEESIDVEGDDEEGEELEETSEPLEVIGGEVIEVTPTSGR